jgi:hypothetical protein
MDDVLKKKFFDLTPLQTFKAFFGWRAKCDCGKFAFWIDHDTGTFRCTACAEIHERGTASPEAHEHQSLKEELEIGWTTKVFFFVCNLVARVKQPKH